MAQEKDLQGYVIEHGEDGKLWHELAQISANNIYAQQTYLYTHLNPPTSSYYRIKMLDQSGNFSYSKMIHIAKKEKGTMWVYPNPTSGTLRGEIKDTEGQRIQLEVINMLGLVIHAQEFVGSKVDIDLSDIPDGVYIIQASTATGNKYISKIIKY